MSITAITQVTEEGSVTSLSSFLRNGLMYLAWSMRGAGLYSTMRWRLHSGAAFSEVIGNFQDFFKDAAVLLDPATDSVVVAYADSDDTTTASSDPGLFLIVFDFATGAVKSGPTLLGAGMKPQLVYRAGVYGEDMLLLYTSRKRGSVYLRESRDGGYSWGGERPVLNNYVRDTVGLAVAPFSDEHVSILQVGLDAKPLTEIGSYSRPRPLNSVVKHPSLADRVLVSEPTWWDATYYSDYTRGALRLSRDGTKLYWSDGVRLGTSDGVNEISLLDVSGAAPVPVSSITKTGTDGAASDNICEFTTSPLAATRAVDLFGSPSSVPIIFDFDLSDFYLYASGTKEIAPKTNGGAFDVVRLSDLARFSIIAPNSTVMGHGVGVGLGVGGPSIICLGTNESGQEYLSIYVESGTSPVLQAKHKMPAMVNKIAVQMQSASEGDVIVSMADRLNVYRINGLSAPIRLTLTVPLLGRGSVYQAVKATNGHLVCACGAGGVAVINQVGGLVSGALMSGISAQTWRLSTTYALNDLVIPTPISVYSAQRKYFRCTQAGTSGVMEPAWGPVSYGTVVDGTARWQEVGSVDAIVTGVCLDEARGRIYAVGLAGGLLGTTGRVWVLDAKGLL